MTTSKALEEFLTEMADPRRPVSAAKLARLSDLGVANLRLFSESWASIPEARRVELAAKLVELAEDNVELNFGPIFRKLLNDEHPAVRVQAINGLWETQERTLIEPLVRMALDDPDEAVRAGATQALGRFALLASTGKLLERDVQRIGDVLLDLIDNEDETVEVHRRAVEAIAPLELSRVPEIIREAFESDIPEMRASSLYAMGLTADPDWVATLLHELSNPDAEMRYEAVTALGEIGEEDTAERLSRLIDDEDSMVQAAAINALGNMGGRVAKRLLEEASRSADPSIAELADAALANLEYEEEPPRFPGYGGERR
jgi:HEAT repeat protein